MAVQPTISKFFKAVKEPERTIRLQNTDGTSTSDEVEALNSEENVDESIAGKGLLKPVNQGKSGDPPFKTNGAASSNAVGERFEEVEVISIRSRKRRMSDSPSGNDSMNERNKKNKKVSVFEKLTPLDKQVKELKDANKDKLLVVRVGYKYKCFAQDAVVASRVLQIKLIAGKLTFDGSNPQDSGHKQFAYCSFPDNRLHVHLERLVRCDLKVGLVEQSETSAIKKFGKDTIKNDVFVRKVTNTFSKATYGINNTFLSESKHVLGENTSIWGLSVSKRSDSTSDFILLSLTLNSGEVVYDEFKDSSLGTEKLETRFRYLEPKELVVAEKLSPCLERFFRQNGCTVKEQGVLSNADSSNHEILSKGPLSSKYSKTFDMLFEYLKDYGNEKLLLIPSTYKPFASKAHMLLNSKTVESLDLFSNNGAKGSLFWLLDHTRTSFGFRTLKEWVLKPLLNQIDIEDRLDAIEIIKEEVNKVFFEALNQMLKNTSDLLRTLNRIAYGNTSRKEVYLFLKQLSLLGTHFESHAVYLNREIRSNEGRIGKKSRLLTKIFGELMDYSREMAMPLLLSMINVSAVMEKDSERQVTEFFNLNNYDHSDGIIQRQREINSVQDELTDELANIREILKRPHLTYKDHVDYLIEVRNTQVKNLPPDWVKVSNTKMVSRFHTPNIIHLVEKLQYHKDLLFREADQEYKRFLSRIIEQYASLRTFIANIGIYDSLLALAATSCNSKYVRPEFNSKKQFIKAVNARNPVIESLDVQYVPNDIHMAEDEGKVLILTGPNMGGKSSYVRQVALLVILAQVGSFVPADSLELGIFDNVFTRIGAFDNILRGESTFKVEMMEILQIIRNSTSKSLLLLDEVGRGTGTEDGKAIACAILEYFLGELNCPLVLFTTHYTNLGLSSSHLLSHYYMDFVEERRKGENWPSVVFLYKLREGSSHNSYGLNVARLAQIDKEIVNKAFELSEKAKEELELTRYTSLPFKMSRILNSGNSAKLRLAELLEIPRE